MRIDDGQTFRGEVRALVFDGDISSGRLADIIDDRTQPEWGNLASEFVDHNLVTNIGRAQMTKRIIGETASAVAYVGVSTSITTPALTDTALIDEIYRGGTTLTQSFNSYYQRYVALFTTTVFGSSLHGLGLFDTASTGGNMWADASITVSKTTTQTLIADWRIAATTG